MSGTIHTTTHNAILGLYTKQAFGKSVHKGEDAWLQHPRLSWSPSGQAEGQKVKYGIYGVFDGHGGKQAANFASKHILPELQQQLAAIQASSDFKLTSALEEYQEQLSVEDTSVWQLQDVFAEALPLALVQTFKQVQEKFHEHTKVSGTTATVAVVVGWDLIIASVGDSTAFLDTGAEVVQVSGTHRLDDNKAERQRCEEAGYEVCKSTVDGKPVGPERVWPGGLAMSRTIGDHMAGTVVLCEPEVRRVALPSKGARLIIASDGLWDALNPKTAAHHVRGMQATKSAMELVQASLKSRGLRDDITVLVVDAMPDDSYRLPPCLVRMNGHSISLEDVGSVDWHRPLEESAALEACQSNIWQRRLDAVQAHYTLLSPESSNHSSATNAGELQSAHSDSMAESSPFQTPVACPDGMAEEDSAEWETVPVKPKREAPTNQLNETEGQAEDGWGEPDLADDSSNGWEVPAKHTKVNHQPDSSPEGAVAIKAVRSNRNIRNMHAADSAADVFSNGQNRGARDRSRGRGRGRGRGRYNGSRQHNGRNQQQHNEASWEGPSSSAAADSNEMSSSVPSSWGAETVFPVPSPVEPSQLQQAIAPRVLTIRRQPQQQQRRQGNSFGKEDNANGNQQTRREHKHHLARGRNAPPSGGRHAPSATHRGFSEVPVSDATPPSQQPMFSFGDFGPGDVVSSAEMAQGLVEKASSNADLDQMQDGGQRPPQRGRGRGRGRGRHGRQHSQRRGPASEHVAEPTSTNG